MVGLGVFVIVASSRKQHLNIPDGKAVQDRYATFTISAVITIQTRYSHKVTFQNTANAG